MTTRPKVLSIVLAGGEGKRLMPLTEDRAKPAVPFGGSYRLIDFVLSNLANSELRQIAVLTQYKSHSLDKHISVTWRMSTMLGNYVTPVPAQQRLGPRWYQGSADAIYQSMNLITDEDPDYIVVFGADNIYRMDVGQMLDAHIDSGLGATVAGILGALVALVANGPISAVLVVGVVVLVNQLEGNFLQPVLMGRALKLHALVILLALTVGTVLSGILGAVLAVPLAAVAWGIIKVWDGPDLPARWARPHEGKAK